MSQVIGTSVRKQAVIILFKYICRGTCSEA